MLRSLLLSLACTVSVATAPADIDTALQALTAISTEGRGNEAAGPAWQEVVKAGPSALPAVLASVGKGGAVADNWLRVAAGVMVESATASGLPVPVADLTAFLQNVSHAAAGRRLAFDLLQQADPAKAEAIEASLLHDPVQELRRGAVQRLIDAARKGEGDVAKATYLEALGAARDEDQTKLIAGELKKLGVMVDLPKHFGFLTNWHVIGPFENVAGKGFETAFPPEREIELERTYDGKGQQAKWQPFTSKDEFGKLDFNKPLGMLKEATAYALATFEAAEDRDAEIRLGSKNAWKVWLNGELLFGRDEYHRGQQMDQYRLKCRLKKGANVVLVKCCQNEQKEEWTVEWEFQLRVCDAAGTAILAQAPVAK